MSLPLLLTYATEIAFNLIRTNREYFRFSMLEVQSSSAAHVTQLVAELLSVFQRQIMAKVYTYPVNNVGTIYDFLAYHVPRPIVRDALVRTRTIVLQLQQGKPAS